MLIRLSCACLVVLAALSGCKGSDTAADAGSDAVVVKPDVGTPDLPATNREAGAPCKDDGQCKSNICFASTCAKTCTAPVDCTTTQDCGSDGKRTFCYEPAYDKAIGTPCPVDGKCPNASLKCFGVNAGADAYAYCSGECKDDMGCPPQYYCGEPSSTDKKRYCSRRTFCARCLHDGNCAGGGKCIKQGADSFCSMPCTKGKTECPRFADCTDLAGGSYCIHKAGSCVGTGGVCQPCQLDTDCETGGNCLQFYYSKESFCATDCATKACPTGPYTCESISSLSTKLCVPSDPKEPKCVSALSPMMEVGDTMPDFAMVGYKDEDADGSLVGEKLQVIHLSDYAKTAKIILFVTAGGWCSACRDETKQFAQLDASYGDKGLVIFQTLIDDDNQTNPKPPTVTLLDAWVNMLKPVGACGLDPERVTMPYNTASTLPLNLILDAKTRKVLDKSNGFNFATAESKVKLYLGL